MPTSIDQLVAEARQLPTEQVLELVDRLLQPISSYLELCRVISTYLDLNQPSNSSWPLKSVKNGKDFQIFHKVRIKCSHPANHRNITSCAASPIHRASPLPFTEAPDA